MFKGKILCELIHSPVVSSHWVLWIDSQRISQSLLSILYMSIITLTWSWLKKSAVLQLSPLSPMSSHKNTNNHLEDPAPRLPCPPLTLEPCLGSQTSLNCSKLRTCQQLSQPVVNFISLDWGYLQNPKHLLRRYLEWFVWPSPTLQSSTITIQSSWHYERTPTHSNRNTCVWNAVNECGLGDWNAETLSDHVFQTSQKCILRLESWNLIRRS